MFDFKGQTAIITGGTRGIGKTMAEKFLQAGARIIVTYTANEAAAIQFKENYRNFEESIDLQKFDVANYEEVQDFYRYVEERYERFEILVNNAGIRKDSVLAMMKRSDWSDVIDINLTGNFYMCKFAVMSFMRRRYGRIINITSPIGKYGFEGLANYAASKAGQIGLTRSLSKEVATRGITVNCVSPGFIETELIQDLPEKLRNSYLAQVPMKRFGKTEEVAHCVLFLASKEASYITGAIVEVTGGL